MMRNNKPLPLQTNLKQQQGLSLVELMIAMTLGLFLIWGVMQSFLTSRQVYDMQQALSRIQENTRMAQEFIAYDIRNAGDYGCASGDSFMRGAADIRNEDPVICAASGTTGINMVADETSIDDDFKYAVYGFDDVVNGTLTIGGATATLSPLPKVGTDVLMVHVAEELGVLSAAVGGPPALAAAGTLTLTDKGATLPGMGAGTEIVRMNDRIAVSDCATTKIFAPAAAVMQEDLTIDVSGAGNYCTTAAFQAGASVRRVTTVYYYIAANLNGGFSLYRAIGNANVAPAADELLEGVEDMQLEFGVDNAGVVAGNADGIIDVYKKANVIGSALDAATEVTDEEWNGWDWDVAVAGPPAVAAHADRNVVRAVRYSLLMKASSPNLLADPQPLQFNKQTLIGGVVGGPGDRSLRQVVTSTVGIRSRVK